MDTRARQFTGDAVDLPLYRVGSNGVEKRMKYISAEGNLSIAVSPDRWQLIRNGDMQEQVMMQAETGAPLHYNDQFGSSRRLPESGSLDPETVRRVVLGWSEGDASWHLGLMLDSSLADERGSRWCELARWHDPEMAEHQAEATEAGEALAQTINRPFYTVPPETQPEASSIAQADGLDLSLTEEAPPAPPVPLAALPLTADLWTLSANPDESLTLSLNKSWSNGLIRQSLWYALWVAVYLLLLYGAATAGIAPIQPEILPYLAIFSAVVLVLLILRNLYWLFTHTNRIRFQPADASVTAYHNQSERWTGTAPDTIKAVYVSHVFSKSDVRKHKADAVPQYSELNLMLADETFRFLFAYEETKESADLSNVPPETVHPLTSNSAQTQLHAIGLHLAQALNVPCYYDFRAR